MLKPLGNNILLEFPQEEKETKVGNLFIPDTAKEPATEGIVVAVGSGKLNDNGTKSPIELQVGDKVLVGKYSGTEVIVKGRKLRLFSYEHVLGVFS